MDTWRLPSRYLYDLRDLNLVQTLGHMVDARSKTPTHLFPITTPSQTAIGTTIELE